MDMLVAMKKITKAVIPAAGFGTRFLPATKAQPKEMLPIIDNPTIQFGVEEAAASGIEDIIIITGRNKRTIEDHFDRSVELENFLEEKGEKDILESIKNISGLADIHFIRQKEQLGLGHAILCAKRHIGNNPFAVLLGDDIIHSKKPVTKQLIDLYSKYGCSVIGCERVSKELIERYGIIDGVLNHDRCYDIKDLVEKPTAEKAPSNLGIIGRYILTPEIFSILEKTQKGVGNEIQLTDGLKDLLKFQAMYAYEFEGKRYDIGNKLDYIKAIVEFGLRNKDFGAEFGRYLKKQASLI